MPVAVAFPFAIEKIKTVKNILNKKAPASRATLAIQFLQVEKWKQICEIGLI